MAITCGTDIVKVDRIRNSIDESGNNFINRVYTDMEIEYCEAKRMSKYQSYAARFAAKESVYKAIAPDSSNEVTWRDVEVKNLENGKPYVMLHGKLQEIAEQKNIKNIDLSLSHDSEYASACVVIEY